MRRLLLFVFLVLIPSSVDAQLSLECDPSCSISVPGTGKVELAVETSGVERVEFVVRTADGRLHLQDTVAVENSRASLGYQIAPRLLPAEVLARSIHPSHGAVVRFRLAAASEEGPGIWGPNGVTFGYQGVQASPLHIKIGVDEDQCSSARVALSPGSGGSVAADTVFGSFDRGSGRCQARVDWRLGDAVGRQYLTATVVGGKRRIEIPGRALARPRVVFATAYSFGRESTSARVRGMDTVLVVERFYDEDGRLTRTEQRTDVNSNGDSVRKEDRSAELDPVFGVDFPLPFNASAGNYLRFFLGVSAAEPTDRFYAGVSLSQLASLVPMLGPPDAIPFSVHLGAQLERVDFAIDEGDEVRTERRILGGWTLIASIEASSLLSAAAGIFLQ